MPRGKSGIKIKGITFYLYKTYPTRAGAQRTGNRLMGEKGWLYYIRKAKTGWALYVS